MLDLIFWFMLMFASSKMLGYVRNRQIGPFKTILNILSFVGVFVHEISHLILNIAFGVKVKRFSVKYRDKVTRRVAPNGAVTFKDFHRNSLMQIIMGSIAPLFISTLLFMFCLDIIFLLNLNPWVNVVTGFFAISLLIGSRPSTQDFRLIGLAFSNNPRYSLYQLFLVMVSIVIVWFYIDFSILALPYDVIYYILFFSTIVLLYFILKYSMRGLLTLYNRMRPSSAQKLTHVTRKRHKPLHPNKLGIEKPRW